MLLSRARRGASGNAATKMVVKPNWSTREEKTVSLNTGRGRWWLRKQTQLRRVSILRWSQLWQWEGAECFTHFEVFVHQSVGVHGLQIPVFVPLWKLGFVFHILSYATSFLHLPARPPVLQQAENAASNNLSPLSNYFLTMHWALQELSWRPAEEVLMRFCGAKGLSYANEPYSNYTRFAKCHSLEFTALLIE